MNNQTPPTTGRALITPKSQRTLAAHLIEGIPDDLPEELAKFWNGKTEELHKELVRMLYNVSSRKDTEWLKFVGTIAIPATKVPFIAKEKFVIDTSPNGLVKIDFFGNLFKRWFLNKVEKPINTTIIYCHKVRDSFLADHSIIDELGGEAKAETTLTEMFFLMEKQNNSKKGTLFPGNHGSIFYVRDIKGVLRIICVSLVGKNSWNIYTNSIDKYLPYNFTYQHIFSHSF